MYETEMNVEKSKAMRISRQSISWTDYIKNEEGLHEVEERC
jgi:hypothetical protein